MSEVALSHLWPSSRIAFRIQQARRLSRKEQWFCPGGGEFYLNKRPLHHGEISLQRRDVHRSILTGPSEQLGKCKFQTSKTEAGSLASDVLLKRWECQVL